MSSRFKHRSHDAELMDDLACAGIVINQTLRELEVINRTLGGNGVTIEGIKQLLKNRNADPSPVTIADLGAGGGDILKVVARWAAKNKINLVLTGIDANPNIVTFARKNTAAYKNISFQTADIFSKGFRDQKFDIYIATLFTHHFTDDELVDLLKILKTNARVGIVINDIHRHWLAFHSIRLLTRFFSRSQMVINDAPLSVLRAFKRSELVSILQRAGISDYSLQWRWAFRWQLVIPGGG